MGFQVQPHFFGQQTGLGTNEQYGTLTGHNGTAGLFQGGVIAGQVGTVAGHFSEPIEETDVNALFFHTFPDFFIAGLILLQGDGGGQVDLFFIMLQDFGDLLHIFLG